jgi:hypothetical protein
MRRQLPDAARGDHGTGRGHPRWQRCPLQLGRARRRAERCRRDPLVRRRRLPGQHRRRGEGLRSDRRDAGQGGAPNRPRRPLRRGRRHGGRRRRRARGRRSEADRRHHRQRDGRPALHPAAAAHPGGARLGAGLAALAPEHPGRYGDEPHRHDARRPRDQLRDGIGMRHRHARAGGGGGGRRPRAGRRRPGGRHGVVDGPHHPRRVLRDARAGRRTRRPRPRLAAVRRHPGRLRDGGGGGGPRARGARAGAVARGPDLL